MNGLKKQILVIEDEKDMADLIVRALRNVGYDVDAAYDGEEGFDKVLSMRPQLVLLDITLPKLDGRDLLKRIKGSKDTKDIYVVIISAKGEQWDRNIGLELGAEEYLEKPLEIAKLLRQVENTFEKINPI